MNRACFLDRDGVISRIIFREGKPCSPRSLGEFEILKNAKPFLLQSRSRGFLNIVITNQPDISRGLMTTIELESMHHRIRHELAVDDIIVCPHDNSDACDCRKPKPGMLLMAAQKWHIDLSKSFVIGDQWKDMEAGQRAGCTTLLIDYPHNRGAKTGIRVGDLAAALFAIEATEERVLNE
jgi:D-glycero-D-manno-heptose 1,7-bisphosphate phosphatase